LEILRIDNEELKTSLNFDGCSLLPYIYQNDNLNQIGYIYSEVVRKDLNKKIEKRSLRTKDYKIIVDFIKGERKLFDLNSDPEELCNIYNIQKEVASELENILNGYLAKDESKSEKENVKERLKELKSLGRI
jgi:arylsulfatase A-like enzyme